MMNPLSSYLSMDMASGGLDGFGGSKRRRLASGRPSHVMGDDFRNSVDDEEYFGIEEDPLANMELYALADTIIENPSIDLGTLPWNYQSNMGTGKHVFLLFKRPPKMISRWCAFTWQYIAIGSILPLQYTAKVKKFT